MAESAGAAEMQAPPPAAAAERDDRYALLLYAASYVRPHDSPAKPIQSSSSSSMASDVDALAGPLDVERVRVKLEAARARLGGPWADIPTGRVYDAPPDSAEESAYDALEKAYNQAFCATAQGASASAAATAGDSLPKAVAAVAGSAPNGREPASKADSTPASSREVAVEDPTPAAAAPSAPSAPHVLDSALDQLEKAADSPIVKSSGRGGVAEEGQPMTDSETEASRSADDGAQSLSSSPKHLGVSTHSSSAEAPSTPPDVVDSVKYEDVATIDPSLEQRTSTDAAQAVRGDENEALNDFLVAEMQLFAGHLLGRYPRVFTPSDHDVAHVTSLQLYHNHQRALMDFDASTKRYILWTKPVVSSNTAPAGGLVLAEPPAVLCQNPFQNSSAEPDEARWSTLLRTVQPLTRPDSLEASSRLPERGIDPLFMRPLQFHANGLNAVMLKRGDGDKERRSAAMLLTNLTSAGPPSYLHLVVCADIDLQGWQEALHSNKSLQVYPCWGSRGERQQVIKALNEQYARDQLQSQVVLASFDAFAEDSAMLSLLPFQLALVDMPDSRRDQIDAKWSCVMSQRCRQRVLMCSEDYEVDARRLLHFVLPGLFSSRRKFLAWNYAALDPAQILAVCRVIEAFNILSEDDSVRRFVQRSAVMTQENCDHELAALGVLNKPGVVRSVAPLIKIQTKSGVLKKFRNRASSSISANKAKATVKEDPELAVNSSAASQSPTVFLKQKRRGSRSGCHSRKRISRCGKCTGCLSEDCMVCGHCKDMKKYGGPGLRKQSCKNRKCLNPKSWGPPSKRRKRSKQASHKADGASDDAEDVASSVHEDSDMYDDSEYMNASYSSMDSDHESIPSSLRLSTRDGADSDSDGEISSRLSDDGSVDSPRSINLLLPASDTFTDDNLSLSDLSARSSRNRVMRCGKCAGCTAQDCMKCRHCLDMKKYGGPGLRKQSCKNRKCIAPKIVVLNQGNEGEYVDETGNIVSAEFLEAPDLSDPSDSVGSVAATSAPAEDRSQFLSVIQQCGIFVEPRLVFQCATCTARFCSKPFLDFHKRVEHQSSKAASGSDTTTLALERQASRLFLHPITQIAIVTSLLRQQDRSQRACPLGYAKLEGPDFQYFFIEPYAVLGRLQLQWCELYKDLDVRDLKGLPGGAVDCHLGNDRTIAEQHALISWDAQRGQFVISCLSAHWPITVDGQDVSFSSPPIPLRTRALVQIGASTFYFLLPRAEPGAATPASRRPRIPRESVRDWVRAAVEKRRERSQPPPSLAVGGSEGRTKTEDA